MTWSIKEAFGLKNEGPPEDERNRGETADQRRKRELDAAAAAGNPLTRPTSAAAGGGEHRMSTITRTTPTKAPTPLGTGKGVARRVPAGASRAKQLGSTPERMYDRDADPEAGPTKRSTTPPIKPGHAGSFVGQVWQPTGATRKWTNRYFDVGAGHEKRAGGESQAKRPEALYWDGKDWVSQAHFVMGKRGEAPPTQAAKRTGGETMTPLPPSRDEAEQRAKREIQRVMTKGSKDREEARKAAAAVYDDFDKRYAEYSRATGKPAHKIERPGWIAGEQPRQGAWDRLNKKLSPGGPKEYESWDDVPPEQRREIERYLASQGQQGKATASTPPKSPAGPPQSQDAPTPTPQGGNQAPARAPWRALQRMTGGPKERESDADVLARMRARHGMGPKGESMIRYALGLGAGLFETLEGATLGDLGGQATDPGEPDDLEEKSMGFAALKGKLSHQAGVHDPAALAASIGRKKLGSAEMARRSAAGRRKHTG